MTHSAQKLQNIFAQGGGIVFFGGAGVSTASGIPDFRSAQGLYRESYAYPPEQILSHTFFRTHPKEFFAFYRDKMLYLDAEPNAVHDGLARLEKAGKLDAVVTQNVDGLHQKAGSKRVLELHGSVHRNYCMECGKIYDALFVKQSQGVPLCGCGGCVRPDVVLYEEGLDDAVVRQAVEAVRNARVLIVGGTSLVVYPAAGFVDYFKGEQLVIINRTPTGRDHQADLLISEDIAQIFEEIGVDV